MEKREIPRNVDGRIKVWIIPLKNFLVTLPVNLAIGGLVIANNVSPMSLFLGTTTIACVTGLSLEIQGETAFKHILDYIKYERNGDIVFTRDTTQIEEHKKLIKDKK